KKATESGISARNTMVVPCMVNRALKVRASMKVLLGVASWTRMSTASMPPSRKKKNAVTKYRTAIRLWSTVVIHDHTPLCDLGLACAWTVAVAVTLDMRVSLSPKGDVGYLRVVR